MRYTTLLLKNFATDASNGFSIPITLPIKATKITPVITYIPTTAEQAAGYDYLIECENLVNKYCSTPYLGHINSTTFVHDIFPNKLGFDPSLGSSFLFNVKIIKASDKTVVVSSGNTLQGILKIYLHFDE